MGINSGGVGMYFLALSGQRVGYGMMSREGIELYRSRYIEDKVEPEAAMIQNRYWEKTGKQMLASEAMVVALLNLDEQVTIEFTGKEYDYES